MVKLPHSQQGTQETTGQTTRRRFLIVLQQNASLHFPLTSLSEAPTSPKKVILTAGMSFDKSPATKSTASPAGDLHATSHIS